jgi:hypothetical protein
MEIFFQRQINHGAIATTPFTNADEQEEEKRSSIIFSPSLSL